MTDGVLQLANGGIYQDTVVELALPALDSEYQKDIDEMFLEVCQIKRSFYKDSIQIHYFRVISMAVPDRPQQKSNVFMAF